MDERVGGRGGICCSADGEELQGGKAREEKCRSFCVDLVPLPNGGMAAVQGDCGWGL